MATISGNVCNSYVHIDLIVNETGTSIENNTSTVYWKLVGYLGSGASSSHWYSNSYHSINVSINGTTVYSLPNTTQKSISIGTNTSASSPMTIASGYATVPHNADGSKTCACSFSVVYRYNSTFTWKGSGNVGLTTIARASQPSCITYPNTTQNVGALGSTITIHMNSKSSAFRHTVRYAWGSKKGTIASNVKDNCNWVIPLEFANNVPNATSSWGTIYVDTYNGSKLVGTKSVTFTATVPSTMVPSISAINLSDATGLSNTYGGYIKTKSKAKISVSASGSYSSTISSYSISVNGTTYNSQAVTTDVLKTVGTNTISVTVTDSRGRKSSKSKSFNVLDYNVPVLSEFSNNRCNEDGTINDNGENIKTTVTWSSNSLNSKNILTLHIYSKKKDSNNWEEIASSSNNSGTKSVIFVADGTSSYDVKLVISDKFNSATYTREIGTTYRLINFRSTGKGIAIGKVSEEDLFDVNMDTRFRKDVRSEGDVIAGLGTSNQVSLIGLKGLKDDLMGGGSAYANGWEEGASTLKAGKNTMIYAETILKTGVYLFVPSFRTTLPSGHIFSVGIFDYTTLQYPVTQYMDMCTMIGTGRKHDMNGIQIFNAVAGKRYYVMGYSTADITLDSINWFHIFCLKTT